MKYPKPDMKHRKSKKSKEPEPKRIPAEDKTIFVNGVEIFIDAKANNWESIVRRPYYQMRGKRISESQAFEIIRLTDAFFSWELDLEQAVHSINFNMWWFSTNHFPYKYGWISPDGFVGTNGIMQKWPDINEIIEEWSTYVSLFPYLDLIVGITWWNEMPDERWELFSDYINHKISDDEYIYKEYDGFLENLDIGIWVHDGKIEIIDAEKTAKIYKEYDEKYSESNKKIYVSNYNQDFQPDIVNFEYLKKCISTYGIDDPETYLEKNLNPFIFKDIKEKL